MPRAITRHNMLASCRHTSARCTRSNAAMFCSHRRNTGAAHTHAHLAPNTRRTHCVLNLSDAAAARYAAPRAHGGDGRRRLTTPSHIQPSATPGILRQTLWPRARPPQAHEAFDQCQEAGITAWHCINGHGVGCLSRSATLSRA